LKGGFMPSKFYIETELETIIETSLTDAATVMKIIGIEHPKGTSIVFEHKHIPHLIGTIGLALSDFDDDHFFRQATDRRMAVDSDGTLRLYGILIKLTALLTKAYNLKTNVIFE